VFPGRIGREAGSPPSDDHPEPVGSACCRVWWRPARRASRPRRSTAAASKPGSTVSARSRVQSPSSRPRGHRCATEAGRPANGRRAPTPRRSLVACCGCGRRRRASARRTFGFAPVDPLVATTSASPGSTSFADAHRRARGLALRRSVAAAGRRRTLHRRRSQMRCNSSTNAGPPGRSIATSRFTQGSGRSG
jgi:hypothetical protein